MHPLMKICVDLSFMRLQDVESVEADACFSTSVSKISISAFSLDIFLGGSQSSG